MGKKHTFDDVKAFVESNSGCKLLSTEYVGNNENLLFECHCGEIFKATFHNFKGHSKRQCNKCGNEQKHKDKLIPIEEIKKFVENNSECKLLSTEHLGRGTKLRFMCKCGNEFERDYNNFKHSNQRQCTECSGGVKLLYDDVKRYIEATSNCKLISKTYNNNHDMMTLQCECGNLFETNFGNFKVFNKRRCGECTNKTSYPELQAISILEKHKVQFKQQYKFSDCKHIQTLVFDFYLPNQNLCIEIDGKQHHEPILKYGGDEGFAKTKARDGIKNEYCKNKNIKLLRIPYWEFDNMENILKSVLP